MRPRIPLDGPFARPFRVGDARRSGIGEGRLRGRDLGRPFHGVRSAVDAAPETAYAPLLRSGERFSHASAARIWGAPLPDESDLVHVTVREGTRARSHGVVGHRSASGTAVLRYGLPVSDPATLVLELATVLDVISLTAVADHLILDPRVLDPTDLRPHTTADGLRRAVASGSGRGVRVARAAAAAMRQGAESPMETRLRFVARDAGLPEPVLQHPLDDARGRIGWFDLAWPERRLIAEYDGDGHRTSTWQYERDIERFDRAHAIGWHVLRVRARGVLRDPATTRERLLVAFARA